MMRSRYAWMVAAICALMSVTVCCRRTGNVVADAQYDATSSSDYEAEVEEWVDSVIAGMTLEQKAAQCLMPALYSTDDEANMRHVRELAQKGVGGLVLLRGDTAGASAVARGMRKYSDIPPLIAIDAEWGLGMRLSDARSFRKAPLLGMDADDNDMFEIGRELAADCRRYGINMVLGPVLDISSGGMMDKRCYGSDPERVASLGIAFAHGLEEGGVKAVAKHFPGHGSVITDSHHSKGVISKSLHEMESEDLLPFRRWIEDGFGVMMAGHLAVPAIDPDMKPAAVSPTILRDLLREDMGYKGLLITDALNMGGAEGAGAVEALKAGADVVIAPVSTDGAIREIVAAVQNGTLSESRLNDAVRRKLRLSAVPYGAAGG